MYDNISNNVDKENLHSIHSVHTCVDPIASSQIQFDLYFGIWMEQKSSLF